ncbi:MAG: four helix bundle protein [Ignavibacteriales bacterium]|nr:four helix bundle protein [Ignavibacteriales bacterium]
MVLLDKRRRKAISRRYCLKPIMMDMEAEMAEYQQLQGHRDSGGLSVSLQTRNGYFQSRKASPFPRKRNIPSPTKSADHPEVVAANIAEGFRKRQYPKMFVSKLADADGEAARTQVTELDFCPKFLGYIPAQASRVNLLKDMRKWVKCPAP